MKYSYIDDCAIVRTAPGMTETASGIFPHKPHPKGFLMPVATLPKLPGEPGWPVVETDKNGFPVYALPGGKRYRVKASRDQDKASGT